MTPSLFASLRRGCAALLFAALLCGCLFEGRTAKAPGGGWDDFPNARVTCGDITQDQINQANSLVSAARPLLDSETVYLSSDSGVEWNGLKSRDVDTLDAYYSKALKVAPNHCGALFGKAIVTAYSVVGDQLLDSLVQEAEATDVHGVSGFAKMSSTEAGPALLELKRGLAGVDKSLLTLVQEVSEKVILPKLDSAIAGMEKVVANPNFRFIVEVEGDSISLDRGEAAPLLAALKVVKSLVIMVAGYQWQIETDESYPLLSILRDFQEEDVDSLTGDQKMALDHYTALVQRGSGFSRFRPGWAPKVATIPELLIQATTHVQDGLQYGITQSAKKDDQINDPYRVGTGEKDDIDPVDVRDAIERLERVKKYLRGEVMLTYGKGTETLRINFPKFFRVDGFQQFLPYFRWHPYAEWNDSLPANGLMPERSKGKVVFTNAAGDSLLEGGDLYYVMDSWEDLQGKILFPDPTMGGIFPDLTNANFWLKVGSLRKVESRVCVEDVSDPLNPETVCKLPKSPSDLDILFYFIGSAPF